MASSMMANQLSQKSPSSPASGPSITATVPMTIAVAMGPTRCGNDGRERHDAQSPERTSAVTSALHHTAQLGRSGRARRSSGSRGASDGCEDGAPNPFRADDKTPEKGKEGKVAA
jgi:hypothetical protein